jgi:hypothetical protein
MLLTEFYRVRKDGVNINITIDALIDENGNVVRDEKGHPVPLGFKIHKIGTDEYYKNALDAESSNYKYETTNIPFDPPKEEPEEMQ